MEHLLLAFALIFIGLLMMAAELVLYTHGFGSMLGLAAVIVGAVMVFGRDATLGFATLLALFIAVPLFGRMLLSYWPNTPIGRRFVLQPPPDRATIAPLAEHWDLEPLRGRHGKTLSPLRPSGVVDFDGRRIDAMTEGMLVEAGEWVRCIDVKAGRVLVRPSDGPVPPSDLENMTI